MWWIASKFDPNIVLEVKEIVVVIDPLSWRLDLISFVEIGVFKEQIKLSILIKLENVFIKNYLFNR